MSWPEEMAALRERAERAEARVRELEGALETLCDAADSLTISLPATDTQANIVRNLSAEVRAALTDTPEEEA